MENISILVLFTEKHICWNDAILITKAGFVYCAKDFVFMKYHCSSLATDSASQSNTVELYGKHEVFQDDAKSYSTYFEEEFVKGCEADNMANQAKYSPERDMDVIPQLVSNESPSWAKHEGKVIVQVKALLLHLLLFYNWIKNFTSSPKISYFQRSVDIKR